MRQGISRRASYAAAALAFGYAAVSLYWTVDYVALSWHVALWDLWFLVWGLLLAAATIAVWRHPGVPRG